MEKLGLAGRIRKSSAGFMAYFESHAPQFVFFVSVFYLFCALLLAKFVWVNIDSGWIAETSRNFALKGTTGSTSWLGFLGTDSHYYYWLPLFAFVEGVVFKIFGFGLLQTSLFNLAISLSAIAVSAWAAGRLYGKTAAAVTVLTVVGSFQFLTDSMFHNRPETAVAALNLLAAYYLLLYLRKGHWKDAGVAAFISAVSFSLHPIALIMFGAVIAMIAYKHLADLRTAIRVSAKTGFVFLLTLLPWSIYIAEDPRSFVAQWAWKNQISPMSFNLASEATRYAWLVTTNSGSKLPILLMLLLFLWLFLRKRDWESTAPIILIHLISFAFVGPKATMYFDLVTPLLGLYFAKQISGNLGNEVKGAICLSLLAFLSMSVFALFAYLLLISPNFNYYEINDYLRSKNYSRVIAQPALYYAFEDRLVASEAILWKVKAGDNMAALMKQIDADVWVYDPAVQEVELTEGARKLLKASELEEVICAKNNRLVISNSACAGNPYRFEVYRLK